jgi:hypothetical protein
MSLTTERQKMREKVNKFVSDWNDQTDNYRQTRLKHVDMTNENDLAVRMIELFRKSDDNETEMKTAAWSSQSPNTDGPAEPIEQSS